MARIEVKPGRARVSLKVWTDSLSVDAPGSYMPKEAALVMYQIHLGGALPWAAEVAKVRELTAALVAAGADDSCHALGEQLAAARVALGCKVAECGLMGE